MLCRTESVLTCAALRCDALCCAACCADVREMRLPSQPAAPASSTSTGEADADNPAAAAAAATSLSALSLEDNNRTQPADASHTAAAPVAAGAEGSAPVLPKAFDVAAGSFQCVWFFSLGERHHKPVFEWLQQQLQQQQGRTDGGGAALAADDAAGPVGFTVVATVKEVPQVSLLVASEELALVQGG